MITKVWVVIDVGGHECGVGSEPVGIYGTEKEALDAVDQTEQRTKGWGDGGQTIVKAYEMELPS